MAIKLLASKYVTTDFYMTLDADIVLLQPFNLSQIINHQGKAIYENEARSVHQHWWEGSERFLQVPLSVNRTEKDSSGFGVTPALLSTYGSLLTLGRIQQLYGLGREASVNSHGFLASSNQHCKGSYLDTWIDGFGHDGIIWSEYTLYRVALDYYQVQEQHFIFLQKVQTLHFYSILNHIFHFFRFSIICMLSRTRTSCCPGTCCCTARTCGSPTPPSPGIPWPPSTAAVSFLSSNPPPKLILPKF